MKRKIKSLFKFEPLSLVISTFLFLVIILLVGRVNSEYYLGVGARVRDLHLMGDGAGNIFLLIITFVVAYLISRTITTSELVKNLLGPGWNIALVKIVLGIVLFLVIDAASHVSVVGVFDMDGWEKGFPLTHSYHHGDISKGFKSFKYIAINLSFAYLVFCALFNLIRKVINR